MKKLVLFVMLLIGVKLSHAQKVDSIYFHLYTDSLKKGFYNYINVDGKTTTGRWLPLTAEEISFTCNQDSALYFKNNDLFIDSAYAAETVKVKAVLRSNPTVWKEVVIYIRKRGFDEPLMTNEEAIQKYTTPSQKKKG